MDNFTGTFSESKSPNDGSKRKGLFDMRKVSTLVELVRKVIRGFFPRKKNPGPKPANNGTRGDRLSYPSKELSIDNLVQAQSSNGSNPDKAQKAAKDPKKPTDDEVAASWLSNHPNTAFGLGEFRRYDGGVWNVLNKDQAEAEILQYLIRDKDRGIRPTKNLLASVQELARVQVSVPSELWDSDPDLLPCKNGVLHIPTGELLPHSPDYYFTSQLGYEYDPLAECPIFLKVVNTTIPEAAGFLQEFAGISLTIDTKYELAVWLYGPPGSGKSTTIYGLQTMLGSRAGLLGLADIERSRFSLTNLPGKTLVVATENPGMHMNTTHTLNTLISGEPIEIDRKFRDPVIIYPRAKIIWAMNELPKVGDGGNGLFRRVKIIRYPPLPEGKQDRDLKDAIKQEGPGILNWALEGLIRLKARGHFDIPQVVKEATNLFQETNEIPGLYKAERLLIGPDYKTQSSLLYKDYQTWCYANGHEPKSAIAIAEDWRRFGFVRYASKGCHWWRGVGLKSQLQ